MASEWVATKLSDLIAVKHGFAFLGEHFTNDSKENVLLTPGNFRIGGGFKEDKPKGYSGPIPEEYVLREGDLIVTMTDLSRNTDTLGYPALIPRRGNRKYLHNQRLGKIEFKAAKELDSLFLYYLLCSDSYRNEIVGGATGSTVKHTSPSRITAFTFAKPSHEEQVRIGQTLSVLDKRIVGLEGESASLEEIAKTVFKSWFVDFDPVRAKAAGREPEGMDAATAALFPSDSIDAEGVSVPRGWSRKPLDEAANFLNGLPLQKFAASADEDALPAIKIAQLKRGSAEGADPVSRRVPPQYLIRDGDLIFSWSGSLEVVVWCGGEGALNQHLFKVTSDTSPLWFVHGWLLEYLEHFREIAASKVTTMGHIQRHHLHEAFVTVPDSPTLERLSETMEPLFQRSIYCRLQARTLGELRDTLLPRLISGKLRVPEAEKLVEAIL